MDHSNDGVTRAKEDHSELLLRLGDSFETLRTNYKRRKGFCSFQVIVL